MQSAIQSCTVTFLTMKRASELVPPEFLEAWAWFNQRRGETLRCLPMGDNAPSNMPIKLARQSGIHSPSYAGIPSKGAGKEKYVLSIHSEGTRWYDDKDVIVRPDGTWLLEYCAQKTDPGKMHDPSYNEDMMRNLRDGIPVAVLIKNKNNVYDILGLAFIEEYNTETNVFTLHGPVTPYYENLGCFNRFDEDELTPEEAICLENWSTADERKIELVAKVQRERQDKFRELILNAYEGQCALTEVKIPEVLQAAHIDRYRGKKSQIVKNGVLLRADIHLLYDANLLSIEPISHKIMISNRISNSQYKKYKNATLQTPESQLLKPDDTLLAMHFAQFEYAEKH